MDFPQPAGQMIVGRFENSTVDSLDSIHSWDDRSPLPQDLVPYERRSDKQIVKHVDRGAPGDASLMAMVNRAPEETRLTQQKSQFYGEVFAYREPHQTAREQILQESTITAELKTNVIVRSHLPPILTLSLN